jgi:hypothetical protein
MIILKSADFRFSDAIDGSYYVQFMMLSNPDSSLGRMFLASLYKDSKEKWIDATDILINKRWNKFRILGKSLRLYTWQTHASTYFVVNGSWINKSSMRTIIIITHSLLLLIIIIIYYYYYYYYYNNYRYLLLLYHCLLLLSSV